MYDITYVNIRLFRILPRQVLKSYKGGDPSALLIPLIFNQFYNKDLFSHMKSIPSRTPCCN